MGIGSSYGITSQTGNNIVDLGITMYYDPAYNICYPKSGAVIQDINNRIDATLSAEEGDGMWVNTNQGIFAFSGDSERITLDSVASNNTGEFSWCIWVKNTGGSYGSDYAILSAGSGVTNDGSLYFDAGTGAWSVKFEDSGAGDMDTGNICTVNNWYHIAVVSKIVEETSGTKYLYVNGVEKTSTEWEAADYDWTRIGETEGGYNDWIGNIGPIIFYKGKALTAGDVLQNFNAQKDRFGV